MMKEKPRLCIATANAHKMEEMRALLGHRFHLMSLADFDISTGPEETGNTLVENAEIKANWAFDKLGVNTLADDSGLEVEVLGGAPGVYSARYAGTGSSDADNVRLLLKNLQGDNRRAAFKTVLHLRTSAGGWVCEGQVSGHITKVPRGEAGFGYDPVFVPNGYEKTFAEMTADEKNTLSHRRRAAEEFLRLLQTGRIQGLGD